MTAPTSTEADRTITSDTEPSRYLDYLPAIYREDHFLGRYLKIFENILTPLRS